jgi:hypothetical protein
MILIISSDTDMTTSDVIEWLRYYQVNFFRINDSDKYVLLNYSLSTNSCAIEIIVNQKKIQLHSIRAIWYRRGFLNNIFFDKQIEKIVQTSAILNEHLLNFVETNAHKSLGKFSFNNLLKLDILFFARKAGFEIPKSLVTSFKSELLKFISESTSVISKSIQNPYRVKKGGYNFANYTSEINPKVIGLIPDFFSPALFQQKIKKIFEIRVFYLDGEVYSSGIYQILSSIDYRSNDASNIRIFPVELPAEIKDKTILFFKNIGSNNGSIDIMYDGENYIFLELNPVGQFNFISTKCNYKLEQKVAQWLKN